MFTDEDRKWTRRVLEPFRVRLRDVLLDRGVSAEGANGLARETVDRIVEDFARVIETVERVGFTDARGAISQRERDDAEP